MAGKQELRSEETKKSILIAAGKLFAELGFDSVTMREIAKEARCSHTTIYIYFKDKEALLHQLSMPPLQQLKEQMETVLLQNGLSPESKLKAIGKGVIRFCLMNRNMYTIFFVTEAERVDVAEPKLEINKVRNSLFSVLIRSLRECLPVQQNDSVLLAFTRIFFYTLQGIVGTYNQSEEPAEAIMERLGTTFDVAFDVLLIGFKQKLTIGVN
jgi:AcrR family transcriptional regulator